MGEFTLPTNIKQIGSIGDGPRIYVEDYVCTYLFQYAEAGGYNERVALLVGRQMIIDGQPVLFINGAIQGMHAEEKNGLLRFTDQTFTHAEAIINEFFEGMEIVGWMQSQPSYGCYLNQQYAAYHLRELRNCRVMFVTDPMERVNAFYAPDAERATMTEVKGYFVYYDKNRNMHEYMLKYKATDNVPPASSYIELARLRAEERDEAADGRSEARGVSPDTDASDDSPARPEEVIRRHQAERVRKRSVQEQRRTLNLLVSLSAVLFIICFVMGAGLIQNQDRIAKMEEQLVQLSTAYRNLFAQMSTDATAAVFAPQEDGTENGSTEQTDVDASNDNNSDSSGTDGTDQTGADASGNGLQPAQVIEENGASASGENITAQAINTDNTNTADTTNTSAEAENSGVSTETASTGPTIPETYTIQPGDSLIAISIRFYGDKTKVDSILAVNGIQNPDHIIAGKTILLPRP